MIDQEKRWIFYRHHRKFQQCCNDRLNLPASRFRSMQQSGELPDCHIRHLRFLHPTDRSIVQHTSEYPLQTNRWATRPTTGWIVWGENIRQGYPGSDCFNFSQKTISSRLFFFDAYFNSEKLDCICLYHVINMMYFIKLQKLIPIYVWINQCFPSSPNIVNWVNHVWILDL